MKKVLLFLLLFIPASILMGQEVMTKQLFYCEMVGSGNVFGNKIKISFDFGSRKFSYQATRKNQLVNEDGRTIDFNTAIDALNYMSSCGWKLHTVYTGAIKGNGAEETYRYLLMKEAINFDAAMGGLKLLNQSDEELSGKQEKDDELNKKDPLFMRNMKD